MEEEGMSAGDGRGGSFKGRESDLEAGFERRGPSVEGGG